ncbi:MAG: hypothetical protein JO224_08260 [Pelomonas sp.]|nr:hypothetical protein [Roseateles sp.]MBV8604657.1 hypothetical protein [Roseateles sp.]
MKKLLPMFLICGAALARASEPNLEVELRWVETRLNAAAVGAVRNGAYVVGTLGTVSSQGGGSTYSTTSPDASVQPVARLRVQSGHTAGVDFSEERRQQSIELIGGGGAQAQAQGASSARGPRGKIIDTPVERHRSVSVTPRLAGDGAQLEVSVVEPQAAGQSEQHTTLQVPLNRWFTVARSGELPHAPEPGTYSTSDAAVQTQRELQVRVTVLDR